MNDIMNDSNKIIEIKKFKNVEWNQSSNKKVRLCLSTRRIDQIIKVMNYLTSPKYRSRKGPKITTLMNGNPKDKK